MNRTTIVVGVGIILCATSLFWLQGRFDKSDHDKSMRLVRGLTRTRAGGETFEVYLERQMGRAGVWDSRVTGGCRGVALVTWTLPGSPPTVLGWDVELPSQAVHPNPAYPQGEKLLQDFIAGKEVPPLKLP